MSKIFGVPVLVAITLVSCTNQQDAETSAVESAILATPADSMAMQMINAFGGREAWDKIRFVRFDFSVSTDDGRRPPRKHLWDKFTGRYRLEYNMGPDTLVTVLFNTADTLGSAYINGVEVDPEQAGSFVEQAHRRYINDTYWLTAPLKVFDPGVHREMEMVDGSPTLALSFDQVGYTPGDRYWLSVSDETGRLEGWTYLLQGRTNSSSFDWVDYTTVESPHGAMHFSTRKASPNASIHTDNISFPGEVEDRFFVSGDALLQ